MAKQVSIKINADSKNAESGIDKLEKKLKSFGKNSALTGAAKLGAAVTGIGTAFTAATKAIGAAVKALGECSEAYKVQEKAEKSLEMAARNNPLLNESSVKALKNYASELQSVSNYGDEQLIPMMTRLAASGRSQQEIMQIMGAAVDIAASGTMSLESAVSNLNKTYTGTAGKLSELSPKIKEMTADQLKSGEAVKILAEQYKGMAKATVDANVQLNNTIGDLKEEIGAKFKAALEPVQKLANSILSDVVSTVSASRKHREAVTEIASAYKSAAQKARELRQIEKQHEKERKAAIEENARAADEAAVKRTTAVLDAAEKELEKQIELNDLVRMQEDIAMDMSASYGSVEERIAYVAKEYGVTNRQAEMLLLTSGKLEQSASAYAQHITTANFQAQYAAEQMEKGLKSQQAAAKAANNTATAKSGGGAKQRTRDDLRKEYDETLESLERQFKAQDAIGKGISEAEKNQKRLNTATEAYVKMMSDPLFKGNSGMYSHEVNARKQIAELSLKVNKEDFTKAWEEAKGISATEIEKLEKEYEKQLEEFEQAYKDFISTGLSDEERLQAEQAYNENVLFLRNELKEKIKKINDEQTRNEQEAAQAQMDAILEVMSTIQSISSQINSIIQDAGNLMLDNVKTQSEAEQAELELKYKNGEISEEEYQKKKEEIQKDAAKKEYQIQLAQWASQVAMATANIAQGVTKALADGGTLGLVTAGLVGAAGAVQMATLMASKPVPPKFAQGGFVPGSSYSGDKVPAYLNSGEAVLNARQQRNFMALANGRAPGGGTSITVNNNASNLVSAEPQISEGKIKLIIDARVNDSMKKRRYNESLKVANQNMEGVFYSS